MYFQLLNIMGLALQHLKILFIVLVEQLKKERKRKIQSKPFPRALSSFVCKKVRLGNRLRLLGVIFCYSILQSIKGMGQEEPTTHISQEWNDSVRYFLTCTLYGDESSVEKRNPQCLCSSSELFHLSIFYIPNLSSLAKQEWRQPKHQLQKTWAKRITVISNHNLILLVVTQAMHWEELHMRGAVERALKAKRLFTYWMLDSCSSN